MQTDILLKQLNSSLGELKTIIDKFEKHSPPSKDYTEQLFNSLGNTNKLVSAYLVLKEQKEVSPELNIHLKLMDVPPLKINEPVNVIEPVNKVNLIEEVVITPVIEPEIIKAVVTESPVVNVVSEAQKLNVPKLNININDKFRFINELFASNAVEYNIAIEQLNQTTTLLEAKAYLNNLKELYRWKDDSELVKTLYLLVDKRFI